MNVDYELSCIEILENLKIPKDSLIEKLTNGENSRIYKVTHDQGVWILKFYRQDHSSPSRLEREQIALTMFGKYGISNTPNLLHVFQKLNCMVLSYIPGNSIQVFDKNCLKEFSKFFGELLKISKINISNYEDVPLAVESCQNFSNVINQIDQRLNKLREIHDEGLVGVLHEIEKIYSHLKNRQTNSDDIFNSLPPMISTVDFGINNAIQSQSKLYFIDFEYFGWDHPVHFVSDIISHPANNLCFKKQLQFLNILRARYGYYFDVKHFDRAFITKNIFFDLKWALIMLNPYIRLPVDNLDVAGIGMKKIRQLSKVNLKLKIIQEKISHEQF